ncbi:MAG: hypothetical protein JNM19_14705 [Chitinophagaceae bacterium]|nr:hypothetical protein [Chitinophagaceae bacterium]
MRSRLLFLLLLASIVCQGQSVLIMDFVKVKNDRFEEALYYYRNNWKLYRDIALEKGYIKSYRLERVKPDSAKTFDLVLITEYEDSTQFNKSEENFRSIITAQRPGGPALLNSVQPADFRTNVFVQYTETLFSNSRHLKRKKTRP